MPATRPSPVGKGQAKAPIRHCVPQSQRYLLIQPNLPQGVNLPFPLSPVGGAGVKGKRRATSVSQGAPLANTTQPPPGR